jgi:hypothetical protein
VRGGEEPVSQSLGTGKRDVRAHALLPSAEERGWERDWWPTANAPVITEDINVLLSAANERSDSADEIVLLQPVRRQLLQRKLLSLLLFFGAAIGTKYALLRRPCVTVFVIPSSSKWKCRVGSSNGEFRIGFSITAGGIAGGSPLRSVLRFRYPNVSPP